jgi:Fe2+ transport system protein FeoA
MKLLPLPHLQARETAEIRVLAGPDSLNARLRDLGLVPGHRVQVVRSGSPCILLVNDDTRLCLRAAEAESILVDLI